MKLLNLVKANTYQSTVPVDSLLEAIHNPQTHSSLRTIKVASHDLSNLVYLLLSLEKGNYGEKHETSKLFIPLYNQFNASIHEGVDQLTGASALLSSGHQKLPKIYVSCSSDVTPVSSQSTRKETSLFSFLSSISGLEGLQRRCQAVIKNYPKHMLPPAVTSLLYQVEAYEAAVHPNLKANLLRAMEERLKNSQNGERGLDRPLLQQLQEHRNHPAIQTMPPQLKKYLP